MDQSIGEQGIGGMATQDLTAPIPSSPKEASDVGALEVVAEGAGPNALLW